MTDDPRFPDDRRYHPAHDWARVEDGVARFGITFYAQELLGEVVFWDPPEVGAPVTAGEPYAELESVKAVSDVVAPLSGTVTGVNRALASDPGLVNADPYGEGWLVEVRLGEGVDATDLLDAAAYRALTG